MLSKTVETLGHIVDESSFQTFHQNEFPDAAGDVGASHFRLCCGLKSNKHLSDQLHLGRFVCECRFELLQEEHRRDRLFFATCHEIIGSTIQFRLPEYALCSTLCALSPAARGFRYRL